MRSSLTQVLIVKVANVKGKTDLCFCFAYLRYHVYGKARGDFEDMVRHDSMISVTKFVSYNQIVSCLNFLSAQFGSLNNETVPCQWQLNPRSPSVLGVSIVLFPILQTSCASLLDILLVLQLSNDPYEQNTSVVDLDLRTPKTLENPHQLENTNLREDGYGDSHISQSSPQSHTLQTVNTMLRPWVAVFGRSEWLLQPR